MVPLTSSETSKEPSLATATLAGRPQTWVLSLTNPVKNPDIHLLVDHL